MKQSEFADEGPTLPDVRMSIAPPLAPGLVSQWWHTLPKAFQDDPVVVLVLGPDKSKMRWGSKRGVQFHLLQYEVDGKEVLEGLQIKQPVVAAWVDQAVEFGRLGIRMTQPAYIGRLSEMPDKHLLQEGVCPLLFLRDSMSGAVVNLKTYYRPAGSDEERSLKWS